jgi:hypothetical protein
MSEQDSDLTEYAAELERRQRRTNRLMKEHGYTLEEAIDAGIRADMNDLRARRNQR